MSSRQRYKPTESPFAAIPGARRTAYPGYIEPCHPTQHPNPPKGDNWVHEIKVDGYRCQLHIAHGTVMAYTRRGFDWVNRFRAVADAAKALPTREVIIDGEVIVAGTDGQSDFGALQEHLRVGSSNLLTYYAFDLLHIDGHDLREAPLLARKRALQTLLAYGSQRFLYSQHLTGDAPTVQVSAMRNEGLVSKRVDSAYRSGRNETWIKTICGKRNTFAVVGFAPAPAGSITTLYLGRSEGRGLVYAGKAVTGFTEETGRMMRALLDPLLVGKSPLSERIIKPKVRWVKPQVLVEIEYRSVTETGHLLKATFKGVRDDLMPPNQVSESRAE